MKPKKKLVRTVALRFFEDDANGEWGTAHVETYAANNGDGFNAFWDGQGLFHDVFEHAHELTDKHFLGDYAMNIGGEIAAMGALWYYYGKCGFHQRLQTRFHSPDDVTMQTTLGMQQECITEGYSNFGDTLTCGVPAQEPVDDYSLEGIISEHWERIQSFIPDGYGEEETKRGQEYKDSVTQEKIANLYRYGYRMAEKLCGADTGNSVVMADFLEFWNKFCETNRAETLASAYRTLTFKLYRDTENALSWSATFEPMPGLSSEEVSRVVIRSEKIAHVPVIFDF